MTQEGALTILKTGANVFLTGEPGAGKTHTVNRFCTYLRERGIEPAITASTGIAATHIGGMTVHSWSGIGIKRSLSAWDIEEISTRERVAKRITLAATLIIDEVSMLEGNFLTMLDAVCRRIKNSPRPFGGLQVVFVGDFFQLPPVSRAQPQSEEGLFDEEAPSTNFAFTSSAWRAANPITCYLTEQHRQEDETFLALLSAIRSGSVEEQEHELLQSRTTRGQAPSGITKLFSHNADVDRINTQELEALEGESVAYEMRSFGATPLVEALKKGCLSPERLALKPGAAVMFTKNNFEEGYVNGTLGTISGFNKEGLPVVKTRSGRTLAVSPVEWQLADGSKVLAKITQLPLRLAWAMTVHKSQGMSLDSALVDLSQAFEYGQGYVALSRLRSLAGLYLLGYNARALQVHPELLQKDVEFRDASASASAAFAKMPKEELSQMHSAFIKASGGRLQVSAVAAKEEKPLGSKLEKLREKYPNAYMPWSAQDDRVLREAFEAGEEQKEIGKKFGRQSGSITARLRKLGLIE